MTPQTKALMMAGMCVATGVLCLLGGSFNWDWWMNSVGWIVSRQYGRGTARVHFILFGLMAVGLGAFFFYDALTAPRFWPLPGQRP
jgi:hypothetical protein